MINFKLFKEIFKKKPNYEHNPVISLLVEKSSFNIEDKNAIYLYNLDYKGIEHWDDFCKYLSVIPRNSLNEILYEFVKQIILNKNLFYQFYNEWKKNCKVADYYFSKNRIREMVHCYLEGVESFNKKEEILFVEDFAERFNHPSIVDLISDEKKREKSARKIIKNKCHPRHLGTYLKRISFNKKEDYYNLLKDFNKIEVHSSSRFITNQKIELEVLKDFIEDSLEEDVLTKGEQDLFTDIFCRYFLFNKNISKEVSGLIFLFLKKHHQSINVRQHKFIIQRIKTADIHEEDFEEYIKYLVKNETRAGVLKIVAKEISEEKLPWLLGTGFKTVNKVIKRRMV